MQVEDCERRLKRFTYNVLKFCRLLPGDREGMLIENVIYRSVGSLITQFHAAGNAKNAENFISKLQPVEESLNQVLFWLEYIQDLEIIKGDILPDLIKENKEIQVLINTTIHRLSVKAKF